MYLILKWIFNFEKLKRTLQKLVKVLEPTEILIQTPIVKFFS